MSASYLTQCSFGFTIFQAKIFQSPPPWPLRWFLDHNLTTNWNLANHELLPESARSTQNDNALLRAMVHSPTLQKIIQYFGNYWYHLIAPPMSQQSIIYLCQILSDLKQLLVDSPLFQKPQNGIL